jgi:protein-L-isoaspartate O-methyltransferase
MARQLAAAGSLSDERWRQLLYAVPRHHFAPVRATAVPGSAGGPSERMIDRDADPDGWWDAVYSDMAIITQRDDGLGDPASTDGLATCSLSAPGIVLSFLQLLDPQPGEPILEIGTGTGWTAGLLSARAGQEHVCSIEIDAALLATARANLRAAGYSPLLERGDGAAGLPGSTFTRLHVTCGVSAIPYTWIEQLAPGGIAVLPWMPDGWNGYQVRLTARPDGTALGTFQGAASYMMLRAQRAGRLRWRAHHAEDADVTTTSLDPGTISQAGPSAATALLQVPGLVITTSSNDDGTVSVHLAEAQNPDRSWSACDSSPDGRHVVTQYGPRRLWDEAEACFRAWDTSGRPGPDQYRLLITPDGQHVRHHAAL